MVQILGYSLSIMNMLGLWAFAFLIPFIILYLRKPKVIERTMPSLMFFSKELGFNKKYAFLKKLLQNLLFLLQLLILSALAFSIADPLAEYPAGDSARSTFIIIDASASSQTIQDGNTRFENSIKEAKKHLHGEISILSAANNLQLVLNKGSKGQALTVLNTLRPYDSETNIESAMHRADQLTEKGSRIIVISDFINAKGNSDDVLKAKRILSSQEKEVLLIDTSGDADNVGIIDLKVEKYKTKAFIKNFKEKTTKTTVSLKKDITAIKKYELEIKPDSIEIVTFPTPEGISRIILEQNDDMMVDNTAFISSPENKKIKIVLITKYENSNIAKALRSSKDIELTIKDFPFPISDIKEIDPDVLIINKFSNVAPDFKGIEKMVEDGLNLIITLQQDMNQIDFNNILPIRIGDRKDKTGVNVKVINQFTQDIEFLPLSRYFESEAKNNTVVIADADDQSPLITYNEKGKGKIIYYGIDDTYSDFKATTHYPIFWYKLISSLVETEDINDYNKKLEEQPETSEQGVHDENGKSVAFNLLNEQESDVSFKNQEFKQELKEFVVDERPKQRKVDIEQHLIIIAFIILFIELIYIKRRGDL